MIKNIEIKNKKYKFLGKEIVFPGVPTGAVEYRDKLIVAFDYDNLRDQDINHEFWRAVWCYDRDGNIVWVVDPPYYIDSETGERKLPKFVDDNGRCLYAMTGVVYHQDKGFIEVYGTMGYRLDPETGKLGEIVYKER